MDPTPPWIPHGRFHPETLAEPQQPQLLSAGHFLGVDPRAILKTKGTPDVHKPHPGERREWEANEHLSPLWDREREREREKERERERKRERVRESE